MKTKEIMKKISDSLFEFCIENNISILYRIIIGVDVSMKIKEKELFLYLLEETGNFVGIETKIVLKKEEFTSHYFEFKLIDGMDKNNQPVFILNE